MVSYEFLSRTKCFSGGIAWHIDRVFPGCQFIHFQSYCGYVYHAVANGGFAVSLLFADPWTGIYAASNSQASL